MKRFLSLSDGTFYEPLNAFRKLEQQLAKEQRKLSRRTRKSRNWYKQKAKITKLHIKIADARNDYLHKVSNAVSKNHAVVVLEDLKVKNMTASAKGTLVAPGRMVKQKAGLNRAILDQGWGEFARQLEYKQSWQGGWVLYVNPAYTSQRCSQCGHVAAENRKSQEQFCCLASLWPSGARRRKRSNQHRKGGARPASLPSERCSNVVGNRNHQKSGVGRSLWNPRASGRGGCQHVFIILYPAFPTPAVSF